MIIENSCLTRVSNNEIVDGKFMIPDSVTRIGETAFWDCNALSDVYYEGTEEQWKAISIGGSNDSLTFATIHYNYKGE